MSEQRTLAILLLCCFACICLGHSVPLPGSPATWHMCTMIRMDARFLMEWIEFHIIMGVTSFTIYDHQSRDATELGKVMAAYTGPHSAVRVEFMGWPPHTRADGSLLAAQRHWQDPHEAEYMLAALANCRDFHLEKAPNVFGCQVAARADCLARNKQHHTFVSFTDTDEFFFGRPSAAKALLLLHEHHPQADSFYIPSITFGSMLLEGVPDGALVIETFSRRAPFVELGDDVKAVTQSISACSKRSTEFPSRTMCTVDHGKFIYVNRTYIFQVGGKSPLEWSGLADFTWHFDHAPSRVQHVERNGTLREFHYQHRGEKDLAKRGELWGKRLNIEQALAAPEFWNAVEDQTLSGNTTLIQLLRANIARRMALISSSVSAH